MCRMCIQAAQYLSEQSPSPRQQACKHPESRTRKIPSEIGFKIYPKGSQRVEIRWFLMVFVPIRTPSMFHESIALLQLSYASICRWPARPTLVQPRMWSFRCLQVGGSTFLRLTLPNWVWLKIKGYYGVPMISMCSPNSSQPSRTGGSRTSASLAK